MTTDRARQDAAASTRGTIYQLCVAVLKCYELRPGQKLLIEQLGDVTVEGNTQYEVKHYSDALTDGHPNLWNTLRNWVDDKFDHKPYASLVLYTTQPFGARSTLSRWNDANTDDRVKLLADILSSSERALPASREASPSKTVECQKYVLAPSRSQVLREVAEKVSIEAAAKDLPSLYEDLKNQRVRGILIGKKNDYLDSLIGFVARADRTPEQRWEITFEEFEARLAALNTMYSRETRIFPRRFFSNGGSANRELARDSLFVEKIRDIQYFSAINQAVSDYQATILTLDEEFRSYVVDLSVVEDYVRTEENRFLAKYRVACRRCIDEVTDSQNLYDEVTGASATPVVGFGDTPDGFRNGLLHQSMENSQKNLTWRVHKP